MLDSGRAMLFTGAGFSSAAQDVHGGCVPTSEAIAREIWDISFPGEPPDESALQDLFHHAARHYPDRLEDLLRRRLRVEEGTLPLFYARWFQVPWRRVWTLNVDDIELAAARRFQMARRVRAFSALTHPFDAKLLEDSEELPVVHLNGLLDDGIHHVTFSTTQYGTRLAKRDPWYARFVDDLVESPFVIVGTRLDEAPFWQHLQYGYGAHMDRRKRLCRAWIVSPKLTRARRALLEDLGMKWIPVSAQAFAEEILAPPLLRAEPMAASPE